MTLQLIRHLIHQMSHLTPQLTHQLMPRLMDVENRVRWKSRYCGEKVRNLEESADYHRELLKDSEWRYHQAMDQLGASQRTVETLTKALPNSDTASKIVPRRTWWPFGKRQR